MKQITFVTNTGRSTVIVDDNASLRDAAERANISYQGRYISAAGVTYKESQMDTLIRDITDKDQLTVGIIAKTDNNASAMVVGNAVVVTSGLKLKDLETIVKYRPEALVVVEGEGADKKETFRVAVAKDTAGSISTFAVEFGPNTDEDGHARMTMTFGGEVTKDELRDLIGPAIIKLDKLEEKLTETLAEIEADKAAADAKIIFA